MINCSNTSQLRTNSVKLESGNIDVTVNILVESGQCIDEEYLKCWIIHPIWFWVC